MNIFSKILEKEYENDSKLGLPFKDFADQSRRLNYMSRLTGGKGFRTPAKSPRVYFDGKTRGQRKREARAAANAKIEAQRVTILVDLAAE